jgi:all-trans-retinol 13,14-reductase
MRQLGQKVRWYDQKWYDWLKLPKYLNLFQKRNWTLQDLYDHAVLSPKLQTVLAGQSGDYALPPSEIALLTHTSLVWDYSEGAYYPKYHFKGFVDTIVDAIVEGGGTVRYMTPVEHIEVVDGEVKWVTAGGTDFVAARAYISDLDPKLTVSLMHGAALSPQERHRLTDYEYSASAFNIYLGWIAASNRKNTASATGTSGTTPRATSTCPTRSSWPGIWSIPGFSCPALPSNPPHRGWPPKATTYWKLPRFAPTNPSSSLRKRT